MQMVKESLDEGYCDVSGRTADLDLVGMCSALSYDLPIPLPTPNSQVAWVV